MRIHCSIIEDCSQPFYFSKHTKEKGNDATACTKNEDVTEDWGRRKARYKNCVPPSLSRFPFYSSIQALWQFYRAHNVEIKIREYRGLRTCLQYLFQPSYKQDDMTPSSVYIHYALKFATPSCHLRYLNGLRIQGAFLFYAFLTLTV